MNPLLIPVLDFCKKHWKVLAGIVAVLLLCAGSFSLGRYGTAEKMVTKTEVKTEVKTEIQYVDRVVEKKVYVVAEDKVVHREEHEIKHRDGTVETVKTEDINDKKDATATDDKAEVKTEVKFVDRVVDKKVEVIKDKPLPDWRVNVLAGVNGPELPGLLKGQAFDPLKHLSLGAAVERRVLGPISVGAWGVSSGQVGVLVNLEF